MFTSQLWRWIEPLIGPVGLELAMAPLGEGRRVYRNAAEFQSRKIQNRSNVSNVASFLRV